MNPEEVYWEPWRPRLGQHVRVRLSGECRHRPPPGSLAAIEGIVGHWAEEDGVTGVVVDYQGGSHPWMVLTDAPLALPIRHPSYADRVGRPPCRRTLSYAAVELEPIASRGRAQDGEPESLAP